MLNFPEKPKHKYSHLKVGEVTILPEVQFVVSALAEPDSYPNWKFYTVSCSIFGCTCAVSFETTDEVRAYIERQKANAPRYKKMGGKRKALTNRVIPLQNKIMDNTRQLFTLAGSKVK